MYYIAEVYKLVKPYNTVYEPQLDENYNNIGYTYQSKRNGEFVDWCLYLGDLAQGVKKIPTRFFNGYQVSEDRPAEDQTIWVPINIYTVFQDKYYGTYNEANEVCSILNKSVARRDTTGFILGYVVCNTASPQFNIYGINFIGNKIPMTSFELQPLEVARMAVNFYNSNYILNQFNTEINSEEVVRYTYFMPKGIGQ